MSKKSVGLGESTYTKLVMYRGQRQADTGHLFTMNETIEELILTHTLVVDYTRYQKLGGKRSLESYKKEWLAGDMEMMEQEVG